MPRIVSAAEAVKAIPDDAVVAVNSSSGLNCPDAVLKALGERYDSEAHPRNLTMLHPIAAGDMFGIRGVEHIAKPGLIGRIIGGSYPSGPSASEPPKIWQMLGADVMPAYNVPSGIMFDMMREAAAKRPGVITKVGLDTFVDPTHEGCAMNASAKARPIVRKIEFDGEEWLYFPAIVPKVAIIRASACDERGNMSFEQEGAYLGAMELALAAHNNGGIVIAQVRTIAENETIKPHQVRVPGILVDYIVEAPDQWQTTQTPYDPTISGEVFKPISSFALMDFGTGKAIARRVAQELKTGWAVNLGFGVSANVPRIFIEEGLHGQATWVIEQGAVGGVPLLEFQFGCASNAEAFVPSAYQFTYFQAAGFDCSLLSFLQIDSHGSVNVSKLGVRPHVTAGAGGFVDITTRARKIVYSGFYNAGAKMEIVDGKLKIEKEGKVKKLVKEVEQVSFSGRRGVMQGQDVTYVTERCVMKLAPEGIVVTEIAPGVELQANILDQAEFPLIVSPGLKEMDKRLFQPEVMGMTLHG
ncbi:acyl CoA:acetate/3-ketoacid CoA transferase [Aestuariivirga sp.]|uniref:acyl CoA:acetate/3-ketoacid CoA transferase n=1 Tax=Aestuariivirga sp. TaxID=2650926 RepID=UPI0035939CEE